MVGVSQLLPIVFLLALCSEGQGQWTPPTWTQWVNHENPRLADGDEEIMHSCEQACFCPDGSISDIECQTVDGQPYYSTGENVTCDLDSGLQCKNEDNQHGCSDYRIRYRCGLDTTTTEYTTTATSTTTAWSTVTTTEISARYRSVWSAWINKVYPSTKGGDYESLTRVELSLFCPIGRITQIECETVDGIPSYSSGEILVCNLAVGLVCEDVDNFPIPCSDYKVRYYCDMGVTRYSTTTAMAIETTAPVLPSTEAPTTPSTTPSTSTTPTTTDATTWTDYFTSTTEFYTETTDEVISTDSLPPTLNPDSSSTDQIPTAIPGLLPVGQIPTAIPGLLPPAQTPTAIPGLLTPAQTPTAIPGLLTPAQTLTAVPGLLPPAQTPTAIPGFLSSSANPPYHAPAPSSTGSNIPLQSLYAMCQSIGMTAQLSPTTAEIHAHPIHSSKHKVWEPKSFDNSSAATRLDLMMLPVCLFGLVSNWIYI